MLDSAHLVAFVSTTDTARARHFYRDILDLPLVSEDDFAVVFDANGTMLRITVVGELSPAPFTVLGWSVQDIAGSVRDLRSRGVAFLQFEGMAQDELGIWTSPSGAQVAWLQDPDGNILSLTQPAAVGAEGRPEGRSPA